MAIGEADILKLGFGSSKMPMDRDTGYRLAACRTAVSFAASIVSQEKEIEIAPGVFCPAWTYRGRVPGPRCAPRKAVS
jgi:manganese oxidase